MKKILLGFFALLFCISSFAQTLIQMEEYGGVYRIPCKVNGAKMKLIFDTGAESVCLSLTMAEYLFDNDLISTDDIIGRGSSTVADGSIVDHIVINIKDIEIQGIHLKNIEAVVIDGQNAPLLLGQSAIKKLGKYSISGNKLIIGTIENSSRTTATYLSEKEVDSLSTEADKAFKEESYHVALEKYQILNDNGWLNSYGKYIYANCYFKVDKIDEAFDIYMSLQKDIETNYPKYKADLYIQIAACYNRMCNRDASRPYLEKAKYYAEPWSFQQKESVLMLSGTYYTEGNDYKGRMVVEDYIQSYLNFKKYQWDDCWKKKYSDEFLASLYYDGMYMMCGEFLKGEFYLILSAAWGNDVAKGTCDYRKIDYRKDPNIAHTK